MHTTVIHEPLGISKVGELLLFSPDGRGDKSLVQGVHDKKIVNILRDIMLLLCYLCWCPHDVG
jgi:hypothetical protein